MKDSTQKWIPFKAKFIRVFPTKWYGWLPSMRIEFFGKACAQCMDSPIGIGAYLLDKSRLTASSQYQRYTAPHLGRLFSPGSWTSQPLFQCSTSSDRCLWNRKWFWSDKFKIGVPDDKHGANPAQVLSSNLYNADERSDCAKESSPLNSMKGDCSSITTKEYAGPLISVNMTGRVAGSKLCLTRYALQRQDRKKAPSRVVRSDSLKRSTVQSSWAYLDKTKDLQASDETHLDDAEDFTASNNKGSGELAKEAKLLTKQREAQFASLVERVKKTNQYLIPEQYSSQYLQVDLCSHQGDAAECSDTSMEELGLKSRLGCAAVRSLCPSCTCKPQRITAIATQGSPLGSELEEHEWVSEYLVSFLIDGDNGKEQWKFYGSQGLTGSMANAAILRGGASKDDVQKNFFASPVIAKAIRVHPVCWYGRAMSLRVEVFQCLNEFSWKLLEAKLALGRRDSQQQKALKLEVNRLGEGRRGGSVLSTTGSFTLSSGNRAGNSERQKNLGSSQNRDPVAAQTATAEANKANNSAQTAGSKEAKSAETAAKAQTATAEANKAINSARAAESKEAESAETAARAAEKAAARAVKTAARGATTSKTAQTKAAEQTRPMLPCSELLKATASSFESWTLGMGGSGAIYQTNPREIAFGGQHYSFYAYQRREVSGAGLLQKQLLCYKTENTNEQCCVGKSSKALGSVWPKQALETKLM